MHSKMDKMLVEKKVKLYLFCEYLKSLCKALKKGHGEKVFLIYIEWKYSLRVVVNV